MEKEGEREKEEANNLAVSFSALCKDVVNVLYLMERLKNDEDQNVVNVADEIERLKLVLAFVLKTTIMERGKENEGEREEEENNSSNPSLLPPDPSPCSVHPPSRCATAMPRTASFLTPKAGNFNCNEVIEKIQCYKKWDLCVQGVVIVMQAGGISH